MSPPGNKRKRLRVVRVIVHPIFVIDDGESLADFENTPTTIPASEWDSFPARLREDIAEVERRLNADD